MPLDSAFVGRTYRPGGVYEVGREKVREFADALGETSPAVRDPDAARALGYADVVGPATFLIVVSMRAELDVLLDPALGLDFSRVVHREQSFEWTRPVRAGDRLTVRLTVLDVGEVAGNDVVTTRTELCAADGGHVCTATSTMVARA